MVFFPIVFRIEKKVTKTLRLKAAPVRVLVLLLLELGQSTGQTPARGLLVVVLIVLVVLAGGGPT